jgi:hypothetical protein
MITIELQRNHSDINNYNKISSYNIEHYCTMKNGIKYSNTFLPVSDVSETLIITSFNGMHPLLRDVLNNNSEKKKYKKWPKLSELYYALFNQYPDGLHNSLIDVLVCLRCYLKMRHGFDDGFLQ